MDAIVINRAEIKLPPIPYAFKSYVQTERRVQYISNSLE